MITANPPPSVATFMYFIGRLNPPHAGHLMALTQLVDAGRAAGIVPLILLGSGPKAGNPLDNPITFDLKRRFVEYKLAETRGFERDRDYFLREMTNPAKNVADYVRAGLARYPGSVHLAAIHIIHVAGGKDEDASKLDFVKKFAFDAAFDLKPDTDAITVSTQTATQPTATQPTGTQPTGTQPTATQPTATQPTATQQTAFSEISGTIVRKDAFRNYLTGSGVDGFLRERGGIYREFYSEMAQEMYAGIIAPATKSARSKVEAYLDPTAASAFATKPATKPATKRARRKSPPSPPAKKKRSANTGGRQTAKRR